MWQYIVRRILQAIFTLIVLSVLTFGIAKLTPGSPLGLDDPENAVKITPAMRKQLLETYHLDRPIWEQYLLWARGFVSGDLGLSLVYRNEHVQDILGRAWPTSAQLGLMAAVLAISLGMFLGIIAAVYRNTIIDYFSMLVAVIGIAVPNFVLAIGMILLFALTLHWFPITGWGTPDRMVMPVFVLMLGPLASTARFTRSSMLEVIKQDYVRTARAKGLAQRNIIMRHVLRNALIPVITVAGPTIAGMVTGSVFVEQIFTIPGVANAFVGAIGGRDYPMIMAQTVIFGGLIIFANLTVDVLYGIIDPRIRYS
jgi:ABC-type dipeptide/oligopeptide/nickel transport system permease component